MRQNPFLFYAIGWTAALMIGFSIPGHGQSLAHLLSPDKLWHFIGFLVLGVLWLRAFPMAAGRIIIYAALFGLFVEVYQHLMPINRSFDLADAVADFAGVLMGIAIGRWWAGLDKLSDPEQL